MRFFAQACSGSAQRAHGLDTLRAAAISLVFAYHYRVFVSREPTFGWASVVGWVGVDLFFVLSGYLIANQLMAGIARGERLSLAAFCARRALRTLPVFWFVLALYFSFPGAMGGRTPPPLWSFLSFTQNFGLVPGTAFSHAWSLCIEEQFYLVLPLALVIGSCFTGRRARAWAVLLGLLVLGVVSRGLLWQSYGREGGGQIDGYYPNIYYATLCRFDEFLPGVAVAMLKNFHPALWQRVRRHGQRVLAAGALATVCMLVLVYHHYFIDGYGYGFFMTTFGYSLVAMAFALLVVAALCPGSWLQRARLPGAQPLALWSYSIYLSHKAVATLVQRELEPFGWPPALVPIVITLACVGVGWLLYRCIETPFMAIRERFVPNLFATSASANRSAAAVQTSASQHNL
jgi:peptidoglycan/LPS O-acetylase OafA/YrhL